MHIAADPAGAEQVAGVLRASGWAVQQADSLERGVERLDARTGAVVVLDPLPGLASRDAVAWLVNGIPDVAVVVRECGADRTVRQALFDAGAQDCLERGADPADLERAIEHAWARTRALRRRSGMRTVGDAVERERARVSPSLLAQMEQGLADGDFGYVFQPQYRIRDGELVGFEALLRWHRPNADGVRETLLPGAFLDVAEQTGFVAELGRVAVDRVVGALARAGRSGLRVALNVSPMQFEDSDLAERIAASLARYGVSPDALEIEITETLFLKDSRRTRRTLSDLRALGVRLAIDDFGTGYASLSYLHRIPADVLKMDRSLVTMLGHPSGDTIARAIVELGRRLGLEVIAEGVETRAQLGRLGDFGCPLAQGYLLGRPGRMDAAPERVLTAATPSAMARQVRPVGVR